MHITITTNHIIRIIHDRIIIAYLILTLILEVAEVRAACIAVQKTFGDGVAASRTDVEGTPEFSTWPDRQWAMGNRQ